MDFWLFVALAIPIGILGAGWAAMYQYALYLRRKELQEELEREEDEFLQKMRDALELEQIEYYRSALQELKRRKQISPATQKARQALGHK